MIAHAARALAAGHPVLLLGNHDAMLALDAGGAASRTVSFLVRHSSGFVCVALDEDRCDTLLLPPMHPGGGYAVSVDAVGTGTGISARDRARTLRLLGDRTAAPDDFTRPGHVVPIRVGPGDPDSYARAALALARGSGPASAVALAHLVSGRRPTELAGHTEACAFAARHGLAVVRVGDLRQAPRPACACACHAA